VFGEVQCAFWKEEPSFREVLHMVDATDVYVVPCFISEGYFTREVLPRELQLTGALTVLGRQTVKYCDPVGIHPAMTRLLRQRAESAAPGVPRDQISLVIVGHGTGLNENSTQAIKDQVALIRSSDAGFAEVVDAYMEEAPFVTKWDELTTGAHVVVVPFFIANGLHSYEDIPVMLGLTTESPGAISAQPESVFEQNPYSLRGRQLYYTPSIGTEALLAEVILDQVEAFDAQEAALNRSATPVTA
jgi:sirohydrochlorin cobaltochelatase